ncbi:hypothetical protein JKP88DRAFT_23454 [Tribonema minus]|uniref:Uncharacterized protein n=1 Tax=Tribonema minus TaxID=303371 RepID=A0A836CMT2_9STRA|nr:hypothetical protein JKP88DRAFT_23454 [Tribonema minus]
MRGFVLAVSAFLLTVALCQAYVAPSASSVFTAGATCRHTQAAAPAPRGGARGLTMKRKGKPNVPINARGGYNNMMKAEEAMRAQRASTPANLPVFEIFCRTKRANMWYPCGALGGDERSKATVDALSNGFLSDLYRNALEKGVAESVLGPQKSQLKGSITRMYPQLAKEASNLEFGFKVKYAPLEEKLGPQKITLLTEEMKLGAFDKLKKNFGFGK